MSTDLPNHSGLIARWNLDESSGEIATDDIGGYDGLLHNGPQWMPLEGYRQGALFFDGVDDYVEVAGYQGISGQASRTCSAWIQTTQASGEIITWGSEDGNGARWIIRVNEGGQLRAEVSGGNIIGTTLINDEEWHHIAVVIEDDGSPDITEAKLYVDGIPERISASADEPINTGTCQNVQFGVYYSTQRYFEGKIDDIQIFNEDLTGEDILRLYQTGSAQYHHPDFNTDNAVDMQDYTEISQHWNTQAPKVVISEFMADNESDNPPVAEEGQIRDGDGEASDWIEIYNQTDFPIDLGGWVLSNDVADPLQWQFPPGTVIQGRSYLLVFASGKDEEDYPYVDPSGYLHTNFNLSASGEYLCLARPDGTVESAFDSVLGGFPEQEANISYGLLNGDEHYFGLPTPGDENQESFLGYVDAPDFSHERGFYNSSFSLVLTTQTQDAVIRYTENGTVPTLSNGITYASPISLSPYEDGSKCIRAAAFKPGYESSRVKTKTYIFGATASMKSLPAVFLSGSPTYTFYNPYGVTAIVGGAYSGGVWYKVSPSDYNNFLGHGMDYERSVSMEYFSPGQGFSFHEDCGVRAHGSEWLRPRYLLPSTDGIWSGDGKPSLRLYFRGTYGETKLRQSILEQFPEVDDMDTIVLRAGHNDRTNPFIRDEMIRRLQYYMGHQASLGNFVNLYVNSVYKGYFNLCERIDEDFCQKYYDSDLEWDVVGWVVGPGGPSDHDLEARDGDLTAFNEFITYADTHNLSNPDYYNEVISQLDLEEFIDYIIVQAWGGNWDWPDNNWTAAAERSANRKWRFYVWDAEGCMDNSTSRNRFTQNDVSYPLNTGISSLAVLYQALRVNEDFRMLFSDRIQKHFYESDGVMQPEFLDSLFWQLAGEVEGVIPSINTYIPDTYIPARNSIFINQCFGQELFTFEGPRIYLNKGEAELLDSDDFETGDFTKLPWTSYGDADWFITSVNPYEGTYCAQSGDIKDDELSILSLTADTTGISFAYKVSSEAGFDYLYFLVDGYVEGYWSGSVPWSTFECSVTAGEHTFGWYYYKDGSVSNGSDCAWIDDIKMMSNVGEINKQGEGLDGSLLSFQNALGEYGDIYFTLDGSDPRLSIAKGGSGGDTSANAQLYTSPVALDKSVRVKARTWNGSTWSALRQADILIGHVTENLRISELMYHPSGDPNEEFVELTNTGPSPINLNCAAFTDGIEYTFGDTVLQPGDFLLLVRNQSAFESRYGTGFPIAGEYEGALSDGGEKIKLRNVLDNKIQTIEYEDGWYDITDGGGFSLTAVDPSAEKTAIPVDNLVAAWNFNEASGTTALDSLGLHNGTIVNMQNTDRVLGHEDKALFFDGTDDYVEIPGYKGITGTTGRTCSAWVKTNVSGTLEIITSWGASAEGQAWMVYIDSNGKLVCNVYGGNVIGTSTLNDDSWHHIVVVLGDDLNADGRIWVEDIRLYVDGVIDPISSINVGSDPLAEVNTTSEMDVTIGVRNYGVLRPDLGYSFYFQGLIDEVRIYGQALIDEEIAILAGDIWDQKEYWRPSFTVGGSPGDDDTGTLPDPGSVVINEVLAHSHDPNPQNPTPDWIELHNTTDDPINIGDWFLSDNNDNEPNITKYQIPLGTIIPAHDYIVFYEDQHFGNPTAPGVNIPFALSEGGDAVYLHGGAGGIIIGYEESESFGASASNVAFGRYIKSILDGGVNFVPMSTNTPGDENAYPLVGPVVITEIMYNPDASNTGNEYLELKNISASEVTLQDLVSTETSPGIFTDQMVQWRFSDGIDFIFPPDISIPAGGYLIIAKNPAAFTDYYGAMLPGVDVLGPFLYNTSLSNGGERVQIVRPGDKEYGKERYWIRTERVTYDDESPWPTSPDGGGDALHQKTPDTFGANYGNDVINWQAGPPSLPIDTEIDYLQLHLKFDEMTGDVAGDSSNYDRPGQLVNAPTWLVGYDGGALAFDTTNYVEVAHDDGLNPDTDSWSVAFWMKSNIASQGAFILSKRQSTSPYPGYIIGLSNGTPTTFTAGSKLTFLFGTETGERKGGYTNADIVFSEWIHVCVVLDQDADTVYIYIDGVPTQVYISPNDTLPTINTTTPVYIGKNPSVSTKPYNGLVDDVRIYNKALSAQEVSEISQ